MSTHVYNTLIVTGDTSQLKTFDNQFKHTPEIVHILSDVKADEIYSFQNFITTIGSELSDWGSTDLHLLDKYEIEKVDDISQNHPPYIVDAISRKFTPFYSYEFITKWAHPSSVIVEMAKQYPNLHFKLNYLHESGITGSLAFTQNDWDQSIIHTDPNSIYYREFAQLYNLTKYEKCKYCTGPSTHHERKISRCVFCGRKAK